MPDTRRFRGPHPKDLDCFNSRWVPVLQRAVDELSWLLGRGYSERAAVQLVGDRYSLRDRQRRAVRCCAASTEDCRRRSRKLVEPDLLRGQAVAVDGYNVLLTLEAALSGGVLLLARDEALRDLAAMSAHYRRLHTTVPAVRLMADFFDTFDCAEIVCFLDRPVSNSGRLKRLILETVSERNAAWRVDLTDRTDHLLMHSPRVVASADSAILDACQAWLNLARSIVDRSIPEAWIVDLRSALGD